MTDSLSAFDPRASVWVSANAGSGKTYTLAHRVARLLVEGVEPERILCLTYTKAAAAEMQGRLFTQLGKWSMSDDAALRTALEDIGGLKTVGEDLPRARRLFATALETPGGLKINTIHSFCQYLLARFPLEAGVTPGFAVLDDQTVREAIAEARAIVLERAGHGNRALAEAVSYLVTHTSENRLKQVLDAALGGDRRKLEEFIKRAPDDAAMRAAIWKAHGAADGDSYAGVADSFCAEMRIEAAQLRDIIAWLAGGSKTDQARAQVLERALERDSFSDFRKVFLTAEGDPPQSLATVALTQAKPDMAAALGKLAERFYAAEKRCRAAHAAALAHAALTLALAARAEYAQAKARIGALDYDDLILHTVRLLRERDAAAWVLYKLDEGIDHVLIDEAQDTSPEQWDIVRALTEEFFAGEGRSRRGPRTVFAVGDEKQSIFSFQGADPTRFEENRKHFAKAATEGAHAFLDVPLTTSRRSVPEVLAFVDHVFADDTAREGLTSSGAPIRHDAHRARDKGSVEFWPALVWDKTADLVAGTPVDKPQPASPVVRLADQIAKRIKGWLDSHARLPGHDRPIRPGDIMILMPRREPFASEIIRRLKDLKVDVAGADRIHLNDQIAVMDMVALGRFVLLPEDDLNLAALLRSPVIELSEDDLMTLAIGRRGTLWHALDKRRDEPAFAAAHAFLSDCRARADYEPPYEFYARVLSAGGARKRLHSRLGPEADDAIDEFLSLALTYEAANPPSLEGFLHWLARGDAEIKRDMERGRDEVRVMTVHGAKGLEADIVILPDTTTIPDGRGQVGHLLYTDDGPVFPLPDKLACERVLAAKRVAKDQMQREHRRLFYVALTRARDKVCVCGFANKTGIKKDSWYRLAERAAKKFGIEVIHEGEKIQALGDIAMETGAPLLLEASEPARPEPWMLSAPPPERDRPKLIRPSDAAGMDEPAPLSPATEAVRFRRGLLIHDLLARLPDVAPQSRRDAARRFLNARSVPEEDAEPLIAETLAVLDDPQFAAAFAPGSRPEAAIVADLPEVGEGRRVNGRIDRLAVTQSEVLAVDFKTNRPPPTRLEDVSPVYVSQMALYRQALAKVFPGRRIACALVWTDGPKLMPLPDALMDAEMGKIRARLDSGGAGS